MKKILGINNSPGAAMEKSFKAATKFKAGLLTNLEMESIPLKEVSSLAKDIHVKT